MKENGVAEIPGLIGNLFEIVDRLQMLFPDRPFTPDGHLVGSIGEVVAAYLYGITLEKDCVTPGFDARTTDAKRVEVKLTGGNRGVSISSNVASKPDILLVLTFNRNSGFEEIYNGAFQNEWLQRKPDSHGVISLSLKMLKDQPPETALEFVAGRSYDDLNSLFPNLNLQSLD